MAHDLPGKLIFAFKGQRLGDASSEHQWKRFTELHLYKTETGYVLHIVGGTPFPGEEERHKYIYAKTPEEVLEVLRMRRYKTFTKLALTLIQEAIKKDTAFKTRWEELYARKTRSKDQKGFRGKMP